MSFLAALVPRLASLAVQPAVLAAGVATGVAVGAVGVGTGAIPVADPGPRLIALFECPDAPRVVKNLPSNQNVLVTARSADGQWLEIYLGEAVAERGWARAASLELKAAPDSLPVADCAATATPEPTALASPAPPSASAAPSVALPTILPSPSLAPTRSPKPKPSPKPTPTAPTGPTVSDLGINYATYDNATHRWLVYKPGTVYPHTCDAQQVTFALTATDPDGVASARLYYRTQGGSTASIDMYVEDAAAGLWQADLYTSQTWTAGVIDYWAQATDTIGDTSWIIHPGANDTLELKECTA